MVERDIGTVMNRARTCMAVYNTPPRYWGYAVLYVVYAINRTHPSIRTAMTPHERVFGEKPSVDHLVAFFAPGVYHLTADERRFKAWEWRAQPCRMLGYSDTSKETYVVVKQGITKLEGVVEQADCIFDEGFHEILRESQKDPLFDVPELLKDFQIYPPANTPVDDGDDTCFDDNDIDYVDPDSTNTPSDTNTPSTDTNTPSTDTKHSLPPDSDDEPDTDVESEFFVNAIYHRGSTDVLDTAYSDNIILYLSHALGDALNLDKLPVPPSSVEEAMKHEIWRDAIIKELVNMEDLSVMTDAVEQEGRGMTMKFIFAAKYNNDYSVKHKARLVICGYSQIRYLDYDETYAPTVPTMVVHMIMHLSAHQQMYMSTFDVSSAFLQADNDYDNYGYLPAALFGIRKRVKILKAFYGEKQAARLWSDMIAKI
jgi:hypothetical protein